MNYEMEEPCPCQHCGEWFDLQDGCCSHKWYRNTVICESCYEKEEIEIEIDENVFESTICLNDAVFTINEHVEVLRMSNKPPIIFFTTAASYPKVPKNKLQEEYLELIKGYSNRLVSGEEGIIGRLTKDLRLLSDKFPRCKPITISNRRSVYENGTIILQGENVPTEFGDLIVLNPVRNYGGTK